MKFLPATVHNYPFVVGDSTQAARKLDFTFIQDDRDSLLPIVDYNCGYTVHGFDDDGNLRFVSNIYQVFWRTINNFLDFLQYNK
ncbi:MAG: hypothetical protein IJU55_03130 [Selenomonadaceae bacterium]|nr:hypothetical protein [Selenomonadaceae bacterium]